MSDEQPSIKQLRKLMDPHSGTPDTTPASTPVKPKKQFPYDTSPSLLLQKRQERRTRIANKKQSAAELAAIWKAAGLVDTVETKEDEKNAPAEMQPTTQLKK